MPETESLVSDLQADFLVNVVVLRLLKSHKSHEREKSFEDLNLVLTYLVECDEALKLFYNPLESTE